ncbi:MAG: DNA primase, partial [Clostridia bacterium]|nr:DNA primase [Clostridia bacterium]
MYNDYSSFLQELRDKSNIIDVAQKYVDLEKKGGRYWARCPIHNEKTPSFTLDENRGTYYCFGCHASGDVFSFIQQVEHVDFKEAVQILANRAGMEVPTFKSNYNKEKKDAERQKKERLYMLMREAGLFYYNTLANQKTGEVVEYINKRKLTQATIKTFGLGYSTGYNDLINYLRAKGFTDSEMLESGVAKEKNGKLYDFEAGRLIVPIFNNMNNVVAFGGRVIGNADFMKYKNTEETFIFKKRNELFGVHTLKKAKLKENFNCVIVVEGYMDVISLYQAGIRNVVASMGTALTIEQARLLKYYNNNIYLCYDGDSAGQKATYKGIDILRDAGLNVKVIRLIEGLDPDDIIKQYGVSKFKDLIEEAISPTEYKIRAIAKQFDLTEPDGQGKFAVKALEVLKELSTLVEREAYIPMISELSRLSESSLIKQLDKLEDNSGGYRETQEIETVKEQKFTLKPSTNKYYKASRFLISVYYTHNRSHETRVKIV